MALPGVTTLELRVIDRVLESSGGYVLDFNDATFAAFFAEHGVSIDEAQYRVEGSSKGKRLRYFLKVTPPPLTGKVLAGLLRHRMAWKPAIEPADTAEFVTVIRRLGGDTATFQGAAPTGAATVSEEALLRLVFRRQDFEQLPMDSVMNGVLIERMEEAEKCLAAGAFLSSVVMAGSVLEGMCLGYGSQHPERVNRQYISAFGKDAPKLASWRLHDWIRVLGALGDLSPNVEKFGHALRDFRNFIHPAEQLAHNFVPDRHTARISFHVAVAAAEDLKRAAERNRS